MRASIDMQDDSTLPVIETVGFVTTRTEVSNKDPFTNDGESLNKQLGGTDSNFKRRTTNKLKKYQRANGVESKSIEGDKLFTGYDMFEVMTPPHNLNYLAELYEISAPHYACVNAKVSNIVGLGQKFVETSATKRSLERLETNEVRAKNARHRLDEHRDDLLATLETLNEEDTFTEVLIKVWRDYETTGNGYIEIGRKRNNQIGYVGHIPSQTMRVRKSRDGFVQLTGKKAQFFRNFGEKKNYNPISGEDSNEVIHIKEYSPTNAYYGVPDIIAAKNAVAGNEFADRFNLDYFENKAVPRYIIMLKGATLGSSAEANLLKFFESLKGENHRSIFIPLPPDTPESKVEMKFEAIEANIQDSSFNNYRKSNIQSILMAHRVPVTKVGIADGVSLAVAKDADKTFKEQVCAPKQKILEKKLNNIIREFTDAFELKLNEMSLTDEDTQSKIDERNVKAGIDLPNEARARKGQPGVPGGNERVDLNAKNKISQARSELTTQRQRDSARSANATDSADGGRAPKGDGRTTS